MRATQQALLAILKTLAEEGPRDRCSGICSNVEFIAGGGSWTSVKQGMYNELRRTFKALSLDSLYPVTLPGHDGMYLYETYNNMWDTATEYGRARWALLYKLIDYLEKLQ